MTQDGTSGASTPDPWQPPSQAGPPGPPPGSPAGPSPEPPPGFPPYGPSAPSTQPSMGWAAPSPYPSGPQGGPPPPGAPWGYGQNPPPPPRRSHTGLIIGLVVGAVVVLLAAVVVVTVLQTSSKDVSAKGTGETTSESPAGSPSPETTESPSEAPSSSSGPSSVTLSVPGSVAGYHQVKGAIAKRTTAEIRKEMRKAGPAAQGMDKAKIAIYSTGSAGSVLVFMGYSADDVPLIGAQLATSPSSAIDGVFLGAGVTDPSDHPSGSPGGVLRCGKLRAAATGMTMCAWADRSALIILEGYRVPAKTLASLTTKFRVASVHERG